MKINISPRMRALESFVIQGETVADIGTDHGFVPMDLLANNYVPFAILTDINDGPIEKLKNNLRLYQFDPKYYDIRKGDGLVPLKIAEASTIIIAGMGGENIIDILAYDIPKTKSYKKLVLQPRKRSFLLRDWLWSNGFEITNEKLVKEAEKICEIIVAKPSDAYEKDDIFLPKMMREDPLFDEFLDEYIRKVDIVIDNMGNSDETKELVKPWLERREEAWRLKNEHLWN